MPTVRVNDIQLYYEIHDPTTTTATGAAIGTPLVFLPGLATDVSEWSTIIEWLAQGVRVIALDNRGAGRSDKPDQPYSIDLMASDTAELLRVLGIERAHVLGISMGGKIALALALAHPERIAKLILVSASARRVGRRPWWFGLAGIMSSLPFWQSKYPQPRYAYRRQLHASGSYNCAARLPEIHAPTLILHGVRDQTARYALAEELHAGIAGSQLISFAGGHLFMFFRERQRFLDAVSAFLRD